MVTLETYDPYSPICDTDILTFSIFWQKAFLKFIHCDNTITQNTDRNHVSSRASNNLHALIEIANPTVPSWYRLWGDTSHHLRMKPTCILRSREASSQFCFLLTGTHLGDESHPRTTAKPSKEQPSMFGYRLWLEADSILVHLLKWISSTSLLWLTYSKRKIDTPAPVHTYWHTIQYRLIYRCILRQICFIHLLHRSLPRLHTGLGTCDLCVTSSSNIGKIYRNKNQSEVNIGRCQKTCKKNTSFQTERQ